MNFSRSLAFTIISLICGSQAWAQSSVQDPVGDVLYPYRLTCHLLETVMDSKTNSVKKHEELAQEIVELALSSAEGDRKTFTAHIQLNSGNIKASARAEVIAYDDTSAFGVLDGAIVDQKRSTGTTSKTSQDNTWSGLDVRQDLTLARWSKRTLRQHFFYCALSR